MTKEELKQTGEALIALSEGKPIQINDSGKGWIDSRCHSVEDFPNHWAQNRPYRIKPEPKMRPLRHDEFPLTWWFRRNRLSNWEFVVEMNNSNFWTGFQLMNRSLFCPINDWEWSPDRKQICSFFVEDL